MIDHGPGSEGQASTQVAGWLHVLGGQLCWRGEAGALLQGVGATAPPCWVTLQMMKCPWCPQQPVPLESRPQDALTVVFCQSCSATLRAGGAKSQIKFSRKRWCWVLDGAATPPSTACEPPALASTPAATCQRCQQSGVSSPFRHH